MTAQENILCRAEHFVHRVTFCAEGNESGLLSAQSVTLCTKCSARHRTGPRQGPAHQPRAARTPPPAAPPAFHHGTTPLPATPERPPAVTHPHLPRHHAARDRLRVQPEAPSPTRTQAPRCWQTWELSVQHPRSPGTHDVGGTNPGPGQRGTHAPWHTPGPALTARSRKPPAGAPLAHAGPRRRPGQIRETRSVPTLSPQVAIPWRPVAPRPASGGTP